MTDSAAIATQRQSLAQYRARRGPLEAAEAVARVLDVLALLQPAQAAGCTHGALALGCVWLDADTQERPEITGWPAVDTPAHAPADVQAVRQMLGALVEGGEGEETLGPLLAAAAGQETAAALAQALQDWEQQHDLALIGSRHAVLAALLERMRRARDFPALSDSVARIQRVAQSERDSLSDLTQEILKDVALTHKLLRLVNGVQYARSGRSPVSTVSRAVSLVGFNVVRSMAMSLVLLEHWGQGAQAERMREEFLRAMMAGSIATELCAHSAEAEEAFLGAMFQNLGRLLCQFYFPLQAEQIAGLQSAGGNAQTAELQVLGLSREDLGLGVARLWNLPESLQRSMRTPLGSPPLRAPSQGAERLRWAARAGNEATALLLAHPGAALAAPVARWAAQFARTLSLEPQALQQALLNARRALVAMAQALELDVAPDSAAARLLAPPDVPATDAALVADPLAAQQLPVPQAPPPVPSAPPTPQQVQQLLTGGMQEVVNALVEQPAAVDVPRMVVETLYRALGVRRIAWCTRDAQGERMVARFGLGEGSEALVRSLRFSLRDGGDLFSVVCQRGADTLIADAQEARMQARLPGWYRQVIPAATFLLLPLTRQGRPLALIYADDDRPGAIAVDAQTLGLLRTLRNQALLALQQGGT